jgi:hypothetical protein
MHCEHLRIYTDGKSSTLLSSASFRIYALYSLNTRDHSRALMRTSKTINNIH